MTKRIINLILLENQEEYKKEYLGEFVNGNFNLFDIPIIFSEEDFDHIFTEPESKTNQRVFSFRRAKRMMFIKALLDGTAQIELMFETNTGNIAVFSKELECVIYLRIRPVTKTLQIGTFFDFGKDHSKMYKKQIQKCKEISVEELKEAVSSGPTTSRNADS